MDSTLAQWTAGVGIGAAGVDGAGVAGVGFTGICECRARIGGTYILAGIKCSYVCRGSVCRTGIGFFAHIFSGRGIDTGIEVDVRASAIGAVLTFSDIGVVLAGGVEFVGTRVFARYIGIRNRRFTNVTADRIGGTRARRSGQEAEAKHKYHVQRVGNEASGKRGRSFVQDWTLSMIELRYSGRESTVGARHRGGK